MFETISINRKVQIWKYSPSHCTLLLVINPTNENKTRVAFLFKATTHIDLPTYFHCEKLEWDANVDTKEYRFYIDEKKYFSVTALAMHTDEDELGFYEPIPLIEKEGF